MNRNWNNFDTNPPPWMINEPRQPKPGPLFTRRNDHYRNAYPNYQGGYGWNGRREFEPPEFYGEPQGFGPPPGRQPFRGENIHQTRQFLLSCGVRKDVVRNLPPPFLALVEPEYCGLCAMSLDNSNIATLHYTSKNHTKKQQKWLTEMKDGNSFSGPGQGPMKARELYCELCDVQITSKTHADLHYSGKPHRAIVEGRKVPKNPFLNQVGMEKRLQQLIRREKRKLEEAPGDDEAAAAKKANKPVPGELFCEICKVSVTCFEQMTNHMNGKKHLSKEKQHIFNTVHGVGKSEEKQTEDNGEEKDKEQEESRPEAENGEGEKDNDPVDAEDPSSTEDWKDGSEW